MKPLNATAYLAPEGLENSLKAELRDVIAVYGRLILAKGTPQRSYWAQNIWYNPLQIEITSIQDAVKKLTSLQRNWWSYSFSLHRRSQLIQAKLPHISAKPLNFLQAIPSNSLGSWTLLDENTLLASPQCSSSFPNGDCFFNEDKINPPSRAYLKLWELFTRIDLHPQKHETCVELGASPGGWTWVLADLSKKVIAYDRSELAPALMKQVHIEFLAKDAFKVGAHTHPEADWIVSDIVCYPEKLFAFVRDLSLAAPEKKLVFTIKFQGEKDYLWIPQFAAIPRSHILHLSHNKHELTWFRF